MIFSTEFNITKDKYDDWFDPILSVDTKLFIDPFLIFKSSKNEFKDSLKKTIDFFDLAFMEAAVSKKSKKDLRYRSLIRMMKFPEAEEICLGYSSTGIHGAGSGGGFAKVIVDSIYDSIKLGITGFNHFEEIGLFNEGIGCDRISDMTFTLLKEEFILFTQKICKKHNIPTIKIKIHQYSFDKKLKSWNSETVELPENPYNPGKSVILVPKEFLRELPTIGADDFWDYCWDNKNEEIRDQFSIEIKSGVKKEEIIKIAKKHQDWVKEFEELINQDGSFPYDIINDPKGYYNWAIATAEYTKKNIVTLINAKTDHDFTKFTKQILEEFTTFIENNSGYKLLWNDNNKSKSEEAAQLVFTGIVKHYCKANNIDISREANLGRGPVDFKFSSGYNNRALVEVKLAKNTKFWNGLEKQLVKYLKVEEIETGYFLVVCYSASDLKKVKDIFKRTESLSQKLGLKIESIIVDATQNKPSASKL